MHIYDIKCACVSFNTTRHFISQIRRHPTNNVLDQCLLEIKTNWTAQVVWSYKFRFQKLDINALVYQLIGTKLMLFVGLSVVLILGLGTLETNRLTKTYKMIKVILRARNPLTVPVHSISN